MLRLRPSSRLLGKFLPGKAVPSAAALPQRGAFFSSADDKPPFEKILVANRGEIAIRVMKTAKRMGMKTVAIFSEADVNSMHTRFADEAYFVGPPPTSQSYLNIDNVMQAIKDTGAQAVHPGYGFLSENSHFVERLEKAGVTFVGPPSKAMDDLGDKIHSKHIAKAAGVNIVPGYIGEIHNNEEVVKIANEIGYPVMVKASAGGGGKGMRVAYNDAEAIDAFRFSKAEALASFGDDRILIEKYIARGRHIEIQILADKHKNALYLNERECSIQRRNQKVVEEAPSPFLDPATRAAMGMQATQLALSVGYTSAGTVEFLVDQDRNFYFLEMNTRLQVEHPITEAITGIDIVEKMFNVAAGRPLGIKQSDIGINGWAMESRVYAEDPLRGFLPSIGTLHNYREPTGPGVRCDTGIFEGAEISMYYDPLICKLITHGKDRAEATALMERALDEYVIGGVTHNINFLRAVMDNKTFRSGNLSTAFIPEEFPDGFTHVDLTADDQRGIILTAASLKATALDYAEAVDDQQEGFQAASSRDFVVIIDHPEYSHQHHRIRVHNLGGMLSLPLFSGELQVELDGEEINLSTDIKHQGTLVHVDTSKGDHYIAQNLRNDALGYLIQFKGTRWPVRIMSPAQAELSQYMIPIPKADTSKSLLSPMAGSVISMAVKPGDRVTAGQELCVVEAMKMQNVLRADRDGVIKQLDAQPGQDVAVDAVLMTFAD